MSEEAKPQSNFEKLAAINVNAQVEKKGGLSYLSWAWAVDRLLRADPDAEWTYLAPDRFDDGTMMIYCQVTAFGKSRKMQLPVMDHRNKAIANPDAFQINTAMQRALVKAIALHGLGLYIYAGEDLPPGEEKEADDDKPRVPDPKRPSHALQTSVDAFDELSAADQKYLHDLAVEAQDMANNGDDAYGYLKSKRMSLEFELAIWHLFPSDVRAKIKKQAPPKAPMLKPVPTPAELGSQA